MKCFEMTRSAGDENKKVGVDAGYIDTCVYSAKIKPTHQFSDRRF
jgi:hypothetical protein